MDIMLEKLWYQNKIWYRFFIPFSLIFCWLAAFRRAILVLFFQKNPTVPIIVVGNITVGGVGKTPLVIELAKRLSQKGVNVGIVSRGYGAKMKRFPYLVSKDSAASQVGDEPLLIAKRTGCPVVIAPKRVEAIHYLCEKFQCDVIISDDGLQHYAMGRTIEIVVVDGTRGFGNGWCLPAGPLREPIKRIKQADFIVFNGDNDNVLFAEGEFNNALLYQATILPGLLVNLLSGKPYPIESIHGKIAAVAAIGNTKRFFTTLRSMGLQRVEEHSFADHYRFSLNDFNFDADVVIMTEKDAVKCKDFARSHWYYLPIEMVLPEPFWQALYSHSQLKRLIQA